MQKYNQLKYCLITAAMNGIIEHPQIQMKNLGYKVLGAVPQPIGDCWWFTVEDFIEPLPPYLTRMEKGYNFDYWHGGCYRDCEHFLKDNGCCHGGFACKKQ